MTATDAAVLEQPNLNPDAEDVVVFENVSIGFGSGPVLEDLSFSVAPGETRIILGPAGCGKSVLLKLTNGLLKPDAGRILVFGEEISALPERELFKMRARVGMVFQESALFDSLTVHDNVAYRMTEEGLPEEELDSRVREALRFVELEHTLQQFPSELSGGMRRRVAIARAIVNKPELLLYDSPTGGLDPITSTTIIQLVVKQRDVYHSTSLLVTHRLQDAFVMAMHHFNQETGQMERIPDNGIDPKTKFLILNEGHAIFDGTTRELVKADDPWIKEYLA
ncbi:MAG: ABC transporter ATP-binding protein [Acidobacteriaceae bacterium]